MAQQNPRKPSVMDMLLRRRRVLPEPPPPPVQTQEQEKLKRSRVVKLLPPVPEPAHVPSAVYTGKAIKWRKPPKREFGIQSGSDRAKAESEFDKRFKNEESREAARSAQEDATIIRDKLKDRHIEAMNGLHDTLRWLCSTSKPVPPEAAQDINQRFDNERARFERDMGEVSKELDRCLDQVAAHDLALEKGKQKLLGYVRDYPAKFHQAAEFPNLRATPPDVIYVSPEASVSPGPSPAPQKDMVESLMEQFNRVQAPAPAQPGLGPSM